MSIVFTGTEMMTFTETPLPATTVTTRDPLPNVDIPFVIWAIENHWDELVYAQPGYTEDFKLLYRALQRKLGTQEDFFLS